MRAFISESGELKIKDVAEPIARKREIVVALRVAGLNRRDLLAYTLRKDDSEPLILGSDGAGVVNSVGDDVNEFSVGDEVVINPALNWEQTSDAPPKGFDILGVPTHGTFAEKIVLSAKQIEKKPDFLSWDESGVLALAALTGYRALFTKGQLNEGQTVFIPGAGSGVATYLIPFAKSAGAKVIVTSRSETKRDQAIQLGADMTLDTNCDWEEELKNETIDLVIESVGEATFNDSLNVLKRGGKMVVFGATTGSQVNLDLRNFFYGQYQLLGSTMGSRQEFREMLHFIDKYKIHPKVDSVYSLNQIQEAFDYLDINKQFGKIAIQMD